MYTPSAFRENSINTMHDLMHARPLGLLVTHGATGLQASPLPFLLYADEGQWGVLRAHVARANPHWRELSGMTECLIIFQGVDGYITPSWYRSKTTTGKVVPTWNYATVHAWGKPTIIEDAGWLHRQINDLTHAQERSRPRPWSIDDAPADYIATQLKAVVGIEVVIGRIEGKWKMSQNKDEADRVGVIQGLRSPDDPHQNPVVADAIEHAARSKSD
ncbi:MAG TPA: FMN-binding negative transcriptional regulator [Rhodospirillaceae bacterium]|nr:FMN-binding negative transcriptional regulator [Rhodospirillaceae bacterium]